MTELDRLLKIYAKIAKYVWPNGGTLRCLKCGHVEMLTTEQAGKYLADGWPRHCDSAMLLETAVPEEQPHD